MYEVEIGRWEGERRAEKILPEMDKKMAEPIDCIVSSKHKMFGCL